jgi:competence protein ComEA
MESRRKDTAWTIIIILLLVIIVAGGYTLYRKRGNAEQQLVIRQREPVTAMADIISRVYVGGAVNNPGFYPARDQNTLIDVIRGAGGLTGEADKGNISIYVASITEKPQPQKVNINTAEVWLLQALPEIGEKTARNIIDYRVQNGPFKNTQELEKVPGIGPKTLEKIKDLITVH